MPTKEELDNVRKIMEKSKKYAKTDEDKQKLNKIIDGFNDAADRYLKSKGE